MRKNFLKFIIGMSVSLSFLLGPITAGAVESNTTPSQLTIAVNSEAEFTSFLDKMSKFDVTTLDEEDKKVYDAFKISYSEYIKTKNITLTEQELTLRTNMMFNLFNDFSSGEISIPLLEQSVKYLQAESNDDALNVLRDVYVSLYGEQDGEFQTFLVEALIINPNTLSEKDKKVYEKISSIAKERYQEDAEEGTKIMCVLLSGGNGRYNQETSFTVVNFLRYDLQEYTNFAVNILKEFSADFEKTSDIVDSLYNNVLLRKVDEEGLKFWTSKADEMIKEGKSKSDVVDVLSKEMIGSGEYKDLQAKYIGFTKVDEE